MPGRGGGGKRAKKDETKIDKLFGLVLDDDELEFKEDIEHALAVFETAETRVASGVQEHAGWSLDTVVVRTDKECSAYQQLLCMLRPGKVCTVAGIKNAWFKHMRDIRKRMLSRKGAVPCLAETLSEAVDTYYGLFDELESALESGHIKVTHPASKPLRRSARLVAGCKRKL